MIYAKGYYLMFHLRESRYFYVYRDEYNLMFHNEDTSLDIFYKPFRQTSPFGKKIIDESKVLFYSRSPINKEIIKINLPELLL